MDFSGEAAGVMAADVDVELDVDVEVDVDGAEDHTSHSQPTVGGLWYCMSRGK